MINLIPYFSIAISFLMIPIVFAVYFLIKKVLNFKLMIIGFCSYMANFIVISAVQVIMSIAARDFFVNHMNTTMLIQAVIGAVSGVGIFCFCIKKFCQDNKPFVCGASIGAGFGLWQVISEQGVGIIFSLMYYVIGIDEKFGSYLSSMGEPEAQQMKEIVDKVSSKPGMDYVMVGVIGTAFVAIMAAVGVALIYSASKSKKSFVYYAALAAIGGAAPYYLSTIGTVNFGLCIFSLALAVLGVWFMVKVRAELGGEENTKRRASRSPLL